MLTRLVVEWDAVMKAIKPHTSFIPNMGGASLMEFDLEIIEKHCPFLFVDHQGRRGTEPVWMAGRNGKRMRATFPDRPAVLITSIGPEEEYRWKDAVTSGPEIQPWINDGTAQGLLPWFTKFNGVVPDKRWIAPVADSFGCMPSSSRCWRDDADRRDCDPRSRARRCATATEIAQGGREPRPGLLSGAGRGQAALRNRSRTRR